MVDCGSPHTFFTEDTANALKLDTADHIGVLEKRVPFHKSSDHFHEINVLGTDFIRYGKLTLNYANDEVSFTLPLTVFVIRGTFSGGKFHETRDPFRVRVAFPSHIADLRKAITPGDEVGARQILIFKKCDGQWVETRMSDLLVKDSPYGYCDSGE